MIFREELELEFKRLGILKKNQMAEKSGIGYQYLLLILSGKRPPPKDAIVVSACKKLGLSPERTSELSLLAATERSRAGSVSPDLGEPSEFATMDKRPARLPEILLEEGDRRIVRFLCNGIESLIVEQKHHDAMGQACWVRASKTFRDDDILTKLVKNLLESNKKEFDQ